MHPCFVEPTSGEGFVTTSAALRGDYGHDREQAWEYLEF